MSFSTEQKSEIIDNLPDRLCCKRAMLEGILASRAFICEDGISISLSDTGVCGLAEELIGEIYSKDSSVKTSRVGGRRRLVSFDAPAVRKYLENISGGIFHYSKCQMCESAFLRGVFLASGRASDPERQYSLEFSLGKRTDAFFDYFTSLGLTPRISKKPSEDVIYFKNSTQIEDFFALAGMNQTAFKLMNEKIQSEIRNNANRIANCETNNIDKAVSASMNQISLIEELMEKGLLSFLPDELELTARARMEHKDLSLSQLAAIITPPISKPGLSHRLKKITAIAEELLKKGQNKS